MTHTKKQRDEIAGVAEGFNARMAGVPWSFRLKAAKARIARLEAAIGKVLADPGPDSRIDDPDWWRPTLRTALSMQDQEEW